MSAEPSSDQWLWQELHRFYPELAQQVFNRLRHESVSHGDYHQHRADVSQLLTKVADLTSLTDVRDSPIKYLAFSDALHQFDASLAVKSGVHFGLFGGSIVNLEKTPDPKLVEAINRCEVRGCFAMTEVGRGSDLQTIETTATLVQELDDSYYLLHSPSDSSVKCWIGNAARDATHAVVFAQQVIDGHSNGIQAFLVGVRTGGGRPCPGVSIGDVGYKAGLNGVDNGFLRFDRVRVPHSNLLSRYSEVPASRRFGLLLGELTGGRLVVASGSLEVSKRALVSALLYAQERQAFGRPVIDYQTHQHRLYPRLAAALAHHLTLDHFRQQLLEQPARKYSLYAKLCGLKAHFTEEAVFACQVARECCGGHGYAELGLLRNDVDVYTTFEGDNTVLRQQYVKRKMQKLAKGLALAAVWRAVRSAKDGWSGSPLLGLRARRQQSLLELAGALRQHRDWNRELLRIQTCAQLCWEYTCYKHLRRWIDRHAPREPELRYLGDLYLTTTSAGGKHDTAELVALYEDSRAVVTRVCQAMALPFPVQMPLRCRL